MQSAEYALLVIYLVIDRVRLEIVKGWVRAMQERVRAKKHALMLI